MRLRVLTSMRTLTAVDFVTPRATVAGPARAFLPSIIAYLNSTRNRKNRMRTGSPRTTPTRHCTVACKAWPWRSFRLRVAQSLELAGARLEFVSSMGAVLRLCLARYACHVRRAEPPVGGKADPISCHKNVILIVVNGGKMRTKGE